MCQETGDSHGSTHPRPSECDSRQTIQTRPDHSDRMVSPSRGLPSNMLPVALASSGTVCHQVQQQTATVFYVSWLVSQLILCRHSAAWVYGYVQTSPKLQGPETYCFFNRYLIYRGWKIVQGMQICMFVCLLEPLKLTYPHPKCKNFNTLSQFSQRLLQGFLSYLAHMY